MERSLALLVPSKPNSGRLRCKRIFFHFCHSSNVCIRILYPEEAFSFFPFFFGPFCPLLLFSLFLILLLLLSLVGGSAQRYSRCSRPISLSPSSGNSSSNPLGRSRSSPSCSYFSSRSPHSPSACSRIDFERRFRYFLTCAIHSWCDKPNSVAATP